MSAASRLQYLYLAYLSKPKAERKLYREIRTRQPLRIVELGMGTIERTLRMIGVAQRFAGEQRIEYTGFDLFDARSETAASLPLIVAHRQLKTTGARVKLVPGEVGPGLRGAANGLPRIDLLLVASDLGDAWSHVPRMLHDKTLVLERRDESESDALIVLEAAEIERRAHAVQATQRRRAA